MADRDFESITAQRLPLETSGRARGLGKSEAIHRAAVDRAADFPLSPPQRSLLQLQRQYGNRYVERVVALAREDASHDEVHPSVERSIQQERGRGQGLDSGVRRQMESALGANFSGVRIHADTQADSLSRDLSARAFTTGQDIFFRQNAYQPGTSAGRELIAHELTHVVQQGGNQVRRAMSVSQPGDPHEVEAERTARAVMQSEHSGHAGIGEKEKEEDAPHLPASASRTPDRLQPQPESASEKEQEEKKRLHSTDHALGAHLSRRAGFEHLV